MFPWIVDSMGLIVFLYWTVHRYTTFLTDRDLFFIVIEIALL